MGYRTLLHIVTLQWFSAKCWYLIGWLVSRSFLQNYEPHWLRTWYIWPPRWNTKCYYILSRSSDCPPVAGLWLVDEFSEVFSKTMSAIDFILGIPDLLGGIQSSIAYCHTPAIFLLMLASDWSIGFRECSPKLSAPSTSYLVYITSQVGYRTLLHIVMLQRFSAKCWPLIGRLLSRSFLQNYQPHQLRTWCTWPPSGIQNTIAYWHTSVIFCQMLASDWLIGFQKFSPKLCASLTSYLVYMTS